MEKRPESGEFFLKILNARVLVNIENSEKMSLIRDHLFREELRPFRWYVGWEV